MRIVSNTWPARLVALLLTLGCGGGSNAPVEAGGRVGNNQSLTIEKLGGDPSSLIAGDAFPDSIRVLVRDASGAPKAGASVTLAVAGLPLPAAVIVAPSGDANCDGRISAIDAQIILAYVVGIDVSRFCVGTSP
jgi:hypothetical protein